MPDNTLQGNNHVCDPYVKVYTEISEVKKSIRSQHPTIHTPVISANENTNPETHLPHTPYMVQVRWRDLAHHIYTL